MNYSSLAHHSQENIFHQKTHAFLAKSRSIALWMKYVPELNNSHD